MTDGQPRSADESEYWYVDKLTGRRLGFAPKPDEAMVTFAAAAGDELVRRVTDAPPVRSISQGVNRERGFAAVYLAARAAADITASAEVADALPVMVDEQDRPRYFLPGECTVQFHEGVDPTQAEQLIQQQGGSVRVRQRTPGYYTVAVPAGRSIFAMIRAFTSLPEVVFAEPSEAGFNDALRQQHLPADPDFGRLWGMHNTGQQVNGVIGTVDVDVDAPEAWALHRGNPQVIVTVIDTGADLDHADLTANLLPRGNEDWDFADTGDPVPDDLDGHGTHVAGTAAAAENAVGVIGMAPRCQIMPLRINLTSGLNQNRADAINYTVAQAAAHPARRYVINCSWRTNGDHAGVRNAIVNAVANQVVVVFAAGNANANTDVSPQFPGVYPQVIAVAAIDQTGRRATFSNFGSTIDVSAPGVNIHSTLLNGAHGILDGTSMAAPHVAGLAALVWSAAPGLTNHQVRQIIEDTCDDLDAANPGFQGQLGRGRINAHRAVQLAQFIAGYVPAIPALA